MSSPYLRSKGILGSDEDTIKITGILLMILIVLAIVSAIAGPPGECESDTNTDDSAICEEYRR